MSPLIWREKQLPKIVICSAHAVAHRSYAFGRGVRN